MSSKSMLWDSSMESMQFDNTFAKSETNLPIVERKSITQVKYMKVFICLSIQYNKEFYKKFFVFRSFFFFNLFILSLQTSR